MTSTTSEGIAREIIDFRLDDEGDWVAILDCGHPQHVRHRPPFVSRPWVQTAAGRNGQLGAVLECKRCLDLEWPEGFVAYRQTPEFSAETIPKGLLRDHATAKSVWGRIRVLKGRLRYVVAPPVTQCFELSPGVDGVIPPALLHRVEPLSGDVTFLVEFWRREDEPT